MLGVLEIGIRELDRSQKASSAFIILYTTLQTARYKFGSSPVHPVVLISALRTFRVLTKIQ
jgi:hypothetical protein